jgi:glycosyltransferase involved in cell wall biosynthesis
MGGIETYSYNLMNFFTDFDDIETIFPTKKKSEKIALRAINMIIFSISTLLKIFRKKYDVIHITNFNMWIIGYIYTFFNKNVKIIINIWGLELVYKNKVGIIPKIHKIFVPLRFISKIKNFVFLTCSDSSNVLALEVGFIKNSIETIPLGVDRKQILPIRENIEFKKYFLFAGRIVERKGLSWFVNNVLQNFPDYKLIVVGTIIDKEEFNKIKDNKQVEFLGRVEASELIKLRQESTCVIIPNIFQEKNEDFEAFAFVTVESVAHGALVVASKYQGLEDSLLKGELGELCTPSNVNSWIDNLNYVVQIDSHKKREILEKRIEILNDNFIWDIIFEETYKLYRKFI